MKNIIVVGAIAALLLSCGSPTPEPSPTPVEQPPPPPSPKPDTPLDSASKRLATLDGEGDYHISYQGYLKILNGACQQDFAELTDLTIATQKAMADSGQTISHLRVLRDASRAVRGLNRKIDCTPIFKLVAAS